MRVLVLCFLFGAALAAPKTPNRIVGGSPTTIQEYPFMANMMLSIFNIFFSHSCGGTVINRNSVLSAAHCYYGDRPNAWRVTLGSTYRSGSNGDNYNVEQLIIHPEYDNSNLDNDVAIIRLARPVEYSDNVQPARIAGPMYDIADGTQLTAAGWGALNPGGSFPDVLQHVEVNLINQQLCTDRYVYLNTQVVRPYPPVTENMVCVGILDVGGKDACQGDSGGPLLHAGDILFGITSWGHSCANETYPGVNARVSNYIPWISANA